MISCPSLSRGQIIAPAGDRVTMRHDGPASGFRSLTPTLVRKHLSQVRIARPTLGHCEPFQRLNGLLLGREVLRELPPLHGANPAPVAHEPHGSERVALDTAAYSSSGSSSSASSIFPLTHSQ